LHKLGYRADLANNGLEVLQALQQRVYDLLFLDVQMPEMDGLEAARQICQRWPADKRPTIIAMTGNALMGDREKCLAAGMDDYISKPVRVADLQSALERWGPLKSKKSDTSFLSRTKSASASEVLDLTVMAELRRMPGQDTSMLQELVRLFVEKAPYHLEEIKSSVNEPTKLAAHARTLKSMGLDLGAKRLVRVAQKLEEIAGTPEASPVLVQELENAFEMTKKQLLAASANPSNETTPTTS